MFDVNDLPTPQHIYDTVLVRVNVDATADNVLNSVAQIKAHVEAIETIARKLVTDRSMFVPTVDDQTGAEK